MKNRGANTKRNRKGGQASNTPMRAFGEMPRLRITVKNQERKPQKEGKHRTAGRLGQPGADQKSHQATNKKVPCYQLIREKG